MTLFGSLVCNRERRKREVTTYSQPPRLHVENNRHGNPDDIEDDDSCPDNERNKVLQRDDPSPRECER